MSRKSLVIAGAALVALLATGGAVYAQVTPDGMTRAEVEERAARAFDRLDTNLDGQIDAADRAARQRARFDRADRDGDGQLSFEEFATLGETMREGWRERRGGGGGGERGDGMRAAGLARLVPMLALADRDRDAAITEAEFTGTALSMFDSADTNADGIVTRAEGRALRQKLRAEAQARRQAGAAPAPGPAPAAPSN